MAGITPTSGIGSAYTPQFQPAGAARKQAPGGQFAATLKEHLDEVDGKQQQSYAAIRDLISGKTDNVLPVINSVAKADLSFKLLMGVRNKVVEAYKQTMNMQV